MKILVSGSRTWVNGELIERVLKSLPSRFGEFPQESTLVLGDCPIGADALAKYYGEQLGYTIELYTANWSKLGKNAGRRRNLSMIASRPNMALFFIHDNSPGASMTLRFAKAADIPYWVFREYSRGKK